MAFLSCLTFAKRAASAKVEPVIHDGIRYVAPNDDGRRGYIEAWDVQANKKLWDLTVFTNRIDPKLEEDVQWVFINMLSVRDDTLIVTSERGNTYQIDLKTKAITQSDAARSHPPEAAAHPQDVPEEINRAITNSLLPKEYELSFQIKPFYVCGDFNGDGKTDKVTVVGAGTAIGNGGDDFEWMDSWEVYSKDRATAGKSIPKLHGDALLVSKSEAASGLIYWNGKRYVWLQQGD
jgi:hypothetical protein